jgi:hypothetical protein
MIKNIMKNIGLKPVEVEEKEETKPAKTEEKKNTSNAHSFIQGLPALNEVDTETLMKASQMIEDEWIERKGDYSDDEKERLNTDSAILRMELNNRGVTGKDWAAFWKKEKPAK